MVLLPASYYWPGSEILLKERRPNYFMQYKKGTTDKDKLDAVQNWLTLPYGKRPHFITVYFEQVDTRTHDSGPNSDDANKVIKEIDAVIAQLKESIQETGLKDSVNLIILSDHGMTEISNQRIINVEQILNDPSCTIINTGPISMIKTANGKEKSIYELLKANEKHYKVYYKDEVPEYFPLLKKSFYSSNSDYCRYGVVIS